MPEETKKKIGKAVVIPESRSAEAATPEEADRREAATLARRTGLVMSQLWNAEEKDFPLKTDE